MTPIHTPQEPKNPLAPSLIMIPFQALCHFLSIISLHGHQPKFACISVQTLSRVHHQTLNLNHWKYLYQNRIHIRKLLSTAQRLPMNQRLTSQIQIQLPAAIFKTTLIFQSSHPPSGEIQQRMLYHLPVYIARMAV